MKPLFSIITPTYNRGYIIWKTIQSVQKQQYPHWEMIIVDDGSTDDTEKVIAEFQSDPRIHYYKLPKGNANKARNYALTKAKGEYIAYLDSDDILYENFLSVMREMFTKFPDKVFAIPNYNFRKELYDAHHHLIDFTDMEQRQGSTVTLQDIFHWKVKCAFGTGMVHTKEIVKTAIRWDVALKVFDDWDFVMQMGTRFPDGLLHIPYVLYEYAQRYGTDGKCSSQTYQGYADGFEVIYQKHKASPFMKGQTWYPQLIKKFKKKQEQYDKGEIPEAVYKYFPQYGTAKK